MKTKINGKNPWFFPLILVILYAVIYLPFLTRLGIYWDDWQVVFLNLIQKPAAYWEYFLADRPFSIWTYLLTVPLFGVSPLPWQVFTLTMRIAAAWFFAAALSILWPLRTWEVRWAAVLLLVFPGFTQTTVSIAFSQHFIAQALFFASLWLMLKAAEEPRKAAWMVPLACLLSLMQLMTMEYFAAAELIRPILLYFFFRNYQPEDRRISVRRTLLAWLPFVIPLVIFAVWRFGYYPRLSAENTPTLASALLSDPAGSLRQLAQFALQDTFSTAFSVWMDALKPTSLDFRTILILVWSCFGVLISSFWFWKTAGENEIEKPGGDRFFFQAMIIALLFLLLGGLPVWSTNRQALVGLWSDRFTLAPMAGSALLLAAAAAWLTHDRQRQVIFLGLLVTMAVYAQILNVQKYTENWEIQRDFYWQLKWRAPDLERGTAVVAPKLPTSYISDYSVGFALNAMYGKSPVDKQAQYWFFIGPRAKGNYFSAYQPGLPVEYLLRDVKYTGMTNDLLGISFAAGRECLRVLDPFYKEAPTRLGDDLGGIERDMLPVSNTNRILSDTSASSLRGDVFGSEPAHGWCYFYQKADLARQFQQWQEIPRLAVEAEEKGLRSKNGMEYLPFIEGFAQTGNAEKALETSLDANTLTYGMTPALCSMWQRYARMDTVNGLQAAAEEFFDRVNCPQLP
ncbi:MAG: hypothetical protein GYA15_13200 [Leptolinea sp.]|jgi:hypothetical protein|nr:hypothetical protein [Leptolinea sp.]